MRTQMKKRNSLLLVVMAMFFCSNKISAQKIGSGYVIDKTSKEAIPYAHVIKSNKQTGTLTNDDGYFELLCSEKDTLVISYLGYKDYIIAAEELKKDKLIELSIDEDTGIGEITITANNDFLYTFIKKAKNKLKKESQTSRSKAYFFTKTTTEKEPIELSEYFYNASINKGSVESLQYKNGQSHLLRRPDGGFFINLNISKSISQYSLIDGNKYFPRNPLELSQKKLKKYFKLELDHQTEEVIIIKFSPKKNQENLFSGTMWLDAKQYSIKKVILNAADKNNKLFEGIASTKIDRINFSLIYSYQLDSDMNYLQYIAISYDALLSNQLGDLFPVNTESILHIYDSNSEFISPKITYPEAISDYRLLTITPDTIIWNKLQKQNQIKLSSLQKEHLEIVKSHGINFKFLRGIKMKFFESNYEHWASEYRVRIKKSNKKLEEKEVRKLTDRIAKTNFLSDKLSIETILYLDILKTEEGYVYESSAIVDPFNSYNYLDVDDNILAYINIYFDLTEIYRRQLVDKLRDRNLSIDEINSIYQNVNKELAATQADLKKEAFAGRNITALERWNTIVINQLGIDNFDLFGLAK